MLNVLCMYVQARAGVWHECRGFFFVFFSGGPHFFFLFGAPEYVIIVFPVYAVAKIMLSDIGFECLDWFEKVWHGRRARTYPCYTRIELKLKVSQLFLSTPKHFFCAKKAPIWGLPDAKMWFWRVEISRTCLIRIQISRIWIQIGAGSRNLNSIWSRFQKFELNLEQVREFEFESGAASDFGKPNWRELDEIFQNLYLAMQVGAFTVILGCADHSAAPLHSASSAPR